MMLAAAQFDWIGALNIGLTVIMLVWTISIAGRTAKIETLERDLKASTTAAIDDKISAMDKTFQIQFQQLQTRIDRSDAQNERTQNRITELASADAELRVDVLRELMALKDVVATKADIQRLREELGR